MRNLALMTLVLSCSCVRADTFADLKRTLASLDGKEPISAKLGFTRSQTNEGDKPADRVPVTVGAEVGADAAGVRMTFPRRTLDIAVAESRQTDPEAKKPISGALGEVRVTDVDEYLSAAPKLLAALQRASVLEEKTELWRGQPARLLRLKLDPLLSKQNRKYIKKFDANARIWVSADGVPLAAEQSFTYSGRAMMVISFESASKESFEFERRGNRLVVLRHQSEDTSAGGGESGTRRIDARLTLAPTTATPQAGAQ